MGLVSHRQLPVFSSGLRALLRAGGLSWAGLRPTRVEKYFPLSGKKIFVKKKYEPLTYIPPVVKHSFLDVFAFDNGSQGASM